jgi:SHS2 domain-containing protein
LGCDFFVFCGEVLRLGRHRVGLRTGACITIGGCKESGMRRFELVDHTGDLGIRVFGKDLPDLFCHAAEAFFHVITDPETILTKESLNISIEGHELEELLISWLNEFVYLFDTKGLLFREFEFISLTDRSLEALVRGEPYDEARHPIKTTVKSATYHQLQIQRKEGVWEAQIILDL